MNQELLNIVKALVEVAVIVLTPIAFSTCTSLQAKLKSEMGESDYNVAKAYALDAVKFIEQTCPELVNAEKLTKAINLIAGKFGETFSLDEINVLIESAVKDYKAVISGTSPTVNQVVQSTVDSTLADVTATVIANSTDTANADATSTVTGDTTSADVVTASTNTATETVVDSTNVADTTTK